MRSLAASRSPSSAATGSSAPAIFFSFWMSVPSELSCDPSWTDHKREAVMALSMSYQNLGVPLEDVDRHRVAALASNAPPFNFQSKLDGGGMSLLFNRSALIGLIFCTATYVWAEDPRTTFLDDAVLQKSIIDISRMNESELRAFARYMSVCDSPIDDYSIHECNIAESMYKLQFGAQRALDKFINARSMMLQLMKQPSFAKEYNEKSVAQHMDELLKEANVIVTIKSAVTSRFHSLRSNGQ
jgi:hypothetical protein